MKTITRKEEQIILSILNLKENAYLIAIKNFLAKLTGKKVSLTTVHLPLTRLEEQGLIEAEFGEATAVRGGRRKKIYKITESGFSALEEYKNISDQLWSNYEELIPGKT